MFPPVTKLIKCDVRTYWSLSGKWVKFIDGGNGCFYGIPGGARRVVEFNVEDKSIKKIGPDLGEIGYYARYLSCIKADNGSIYCMPGRGFYPLKIIPRQGQNTEVRILEAPMIPSGKWRAGAWGAGVLANDGCIYYFPNAYVRRKILKLDPSNGDSLSLVGEVINHGKNPCNSAVLGNDGCIYGISDKSVFKFSPIDYSFSYIGSNFENDNRFWTRAVLADDDNMYAVNVYGQILCIETAQNDWKIIGNRIYNEVRFSWGSPVIGADKCIYFPPSSHYRVLRYNPSTQNISFIGESYFLGHGSWVGAVLASDGYIYCIPCQANDILQIDSRHVNDKVLEVMDDIYKDHEYVEGNIYAPNKYTKDATFDEQKCCTIA